MNEFEPLKTTAEAVALLTPALCVKFVKGDDCAVAAKNVRVALKSLYTGTVFSVKSCRFAGGTAVDVNWSDGPPRHAVAATLLPFGEMGTYNNRHPYGTAKYVSCDRQVTEVGFAKIAAYIGAKYNAPVPEDATLAGWKNGMLRGLLVGGDVNGADWETRIDRDGRDLSL